MKFSVERVLAVVLILALITMSSHVSAQEQSQGEKVHAIDEETSAVLPQLADIIPLAAELTIRLTILESKMKDIPDPPIAEKKYEGIQAKIGDFAAQFQRLRDSEEYSQNTLVDLSNAIKQESDFFEQTSKPIKQAIRQLGDFREEWLAEKKRWNEWQDVLIQERGLDQLRSTFQKANETIDTALNLILPQLEAMFKIQGKGTTIDVRLEILANELAGLIAEERRGALHKVIPPMLSLRFFSQFTSSQLWNAVKNGLHETSWPVSRFFAQQGWIFLLQALISLFVIIAVYRNRALLEESKRWHFLAQRTFSAGLFVGYMTTVLIYENQGAPAICKQLLSFVGAISFARLLGGLIETSWKKQFIYGLIIVLLIYTLMEMFNFPLPFFRLYTFVIALTALFFCLRWAKESVLCRESRVYSWSLRLASLFFTGIVIAELWGKASLAFYLLTSFMRSIAAVLVFMLFMHIIRGGLEWLFSTSHIRRTSSLHSDTDALVRRIGLFIDIAIWGLVVVPAIFVLWGVYGNLEEAAQGLWGLGFNLGTQRISVGLLLTAAGSVYASFILSWILQNFLMDHLLFRRKVEKGVGVSIKRLIHYFIVFVGFLLGISILGFEITKLTIMLSALGVGIGFGLQGVVNNFVSGLILLFERPVRVGDYIEMDGNWSEIKKIGLRATTIQTFDQADVIIPNADLVTNQVTNWTLTNRRARLIIPVGVAYGSPVSLVIETLIACADAHPKVTKTPAPQVLFRSFGESSLDFELRIWISDVDYRLTTQSDLHQEIDRRFQEAKIEIAFPQRDLHLRSVTRGADLKVGDVSSTSSVGTVRTEEEVEVKEH